MGVPPSRLLKLCAGCLLAFLPIVVLARDKKDSVLYGAGLMTNIPSPEADVLKAVQEVLQSGVIRGTKEYNKDESLGGATVATESNVFPAWTEGGKVFYKVRYHALDPRNFKDTNDVGTVAVRYVVLGQDDKHTVLRIDALFVEDFKHRVHQSDGSVEGSEYKDIHDHLEAMDLIRQQTADAERQKQEAAEKRFASESAAVTAPPVPEALVEKKPDPPTTAVPASSTASIEELQEHLRDVKQQTQKKVRKPGAPLKSAPFHTATNLQTLNPGTEVLIVISTPYWYGIETHDGQHGWMMRDELEDVQ